MTEDVFGIVGTTQGGAFRVDEVVAEGGFAIIYRAYHGAFRSSVALKCLKVPRKMSEAEQKEFLERFREEAELLFRLSSATPSVVRPLHVGTLTMKERRFVPFIALEWLEGVTLDKLISNRVLAGQPPMDLRAAVKLLTPVADALCRAHKFPTASGGVVSIVHRDLKPENIFIAKVHGGRDVAKVLDFGIAKVKSVTAEMVGRESAPDSTMSAFTPAYGAPEQWLPKRYGQTGPWTDVWGLAITLVEAVCGHAPIDGDHAAMMGSAVDPERRPTPRNEGVQIGDDAEAAFRRALAVDPRERFHEVDAFWNALTRTVGLPDLVVDPGASIAPPAPAPTAASSGAHRLDASAATALAPAPTVGAPAVPDLVPGSRPKGSAPAPVAPGRGPSKPDPARRRPAPAASGSARGATDLVGRSLDLDDVGSGSLGGRRARIDIEGGIAPPRGRIVGAPSAAVPRYAGQSAVRKLDMGGPLKLVGLAVVMMAADWGYAAVTGEVLHYGPARMIWVAGPLLVIGAIRLLGRVLSAGD